MLEFIESFSGKNYHEILKSHQKLSDGILDFNIMILLPLNGCKLLENRYIIGFFKELVILWWGFWWECYFEIDWFPLKFTKLEDGKETLIIPTISLVITSSAPSHRCE